MSLVLTDDCHHPFVARMVLIDSTSSKDHIIISDIGNTLGVANSLIETFVATFRFVLSIFPWRVAASRILSAKAAGSVVLGVSLPDAVMLLFQYC